MTPAIFTSMEVKYLPVIFTCAEVKYLLAIFASAEVKYLQVIFTSAEVSDECAPNLPVAFQSQAVISHG
jgi:hypothetical protein